MATAVAEHGASTEEFMIDELEGRLRAKLESMSGFADDATMAHQLNRIFRMRIEQWFYNQWGSNSRVRVKNRCRHFNTEKDGWLSFEEFQAAMVRLNFVGCQKTLRALFERYDVDGTGFLSFEEFSGGLFGLVPNTKCNAKVRCAVERMRHAIAERGGLNGIRSLARVMKVMDRSGNKKLDREEIKYGLRDFGVDVSERDIDTIMNTFDRDGSGNISYNELLRGLRGNLSPRRREMIQKAFDILDRDGSGVVTLDNIREIYDTSEHPDVISGRKTSDEVLTEFMSQWDTIDQDNEITREEFLEYYKDVSASIDTDDYFELMMRNAWHISGGEGHTENTASRRVMVERNDGSQEVIEVKESLGLDASDYAEVKRRLENQGVKDIKRIYVYG